eukprot:CAMPEP_0174826004 /NCGR_PEP_ID=MMETSP1107-20130205/43385_1 /TAXON_ID=36770 /ORGANISM="Paraphysomonas vestita, Strain GFlagA" /LENGTH=47 /DNA_ID= /DNA_START= /DNA_END= /DNA_ORIENTATION=
MEYLLVIELMIVDLIIQLGNDFLVKKKPYLVKDQQVKMLMNDYLDLK